MIFLLACHSTEKPTEDSDSVPITAPTYYQDVAPVLAENCLSCHREGGAGGLVFDSYATASALAPNIADSVINRRMPPFHADNSGDCQHFEHSLWLLEEEIDTIALWAQEGTPEGEVADVEIPSFEEEPFSTTHSVSFDPYEANFASSADDYRCFIVDPLIKQEGYLTGFEVRPSNREIAHHMILYAPNSQQALNRAYELDAADEGPGYACFGNTKVDSRMIAPWAPGSDQWHYPEGSGVHMEEDQILILQMHYSNASDDPLDSTTVNLNVVEEIEKELTTWFYVHSELDIPPNQEEHLESASFKMSDYTGYEGTLELLALGPHMHKLGRASSAKLLHSDGSETCLINVPGYDFNWQRAYTYTTPITIRPDDRMELRCTFDSTSADEYTYWGDGTGDEMCLMTMFTHIPE